MTDYETYPGEYADIKGAAPQAQGAAAPPDHEKAIELLHALVNEVGAEPIEDNRARRLGAWIEARNWLDSLTNFSRAAQGAAAPPTEGPHLHSTVGELIACHTRTFERAAQGAAAPPDPRGNAAIEAIGRIQRSIHMEGRVASDGTLVTSEAIVEEAREAIKDFHDRAARLEGGQ